MRKSLDSHILCSPGMTEAFAIDGAWWLFWIRRYKQIFNKYLRFFVLFAIIKIAILLFVNTYSILKTNEV